MSEIARLKWKINRQKNEHTLYLKSICTEGAKLEFRYDGTFQTQNLTSLDSPQYRLALISENREWFASNHNEFLQQHDFYSQLDEALKSKGMQLKLLNAVLNNCQKFEGLDEKVGRLIQSNNPHSTLQDIEKEFMDEISRLQNKLKP